MQGGSEFRDLNGTNAARYQVSFHQWRSGGVQGSVGGAGEVSGGQKPVLCAVLAGDAVSHSRYMRHRNRKSAKSKFL